MNIQKQSRILGIVAILIAYGIFAFNGSEYAFYLAILGIIALASPEALDKLPWGPNKR